MFEVIKQEINNPFKPEVVDSTTIILKQKSPFVQMSRNYDGDLTNLTDEEAIEKVLTDFHAEHYKDKIQEKKILELELAFAQQKENFENKLNEISQQNILIQNALFELTEEILSDDDPAEEELEEEGGADESDEHVDGESDQE